MEHSSLPKDNPAKIPKFMWHATHPWPQLPISLKVLHWRGCPLKTLSLQNQLDEIVALNCFIAKLNKFGKEKVMTISPRALFNFVTMTLKLITIPYFTILINFWRR